MIVTRVQIKTATKQKYLYCLVFTKRNNSLPLKAVVSFSLLLSSHFSLLSQTSVPGEMFPFISKVH